MTVKRIVVYPCQYTKYLVSIASEIKISFVIHFDSMLTMVNSKVMEGHGMKECIAI